METSKERLVGMLSWAKRILGIKTESLAKITFSDGSWCRAKIYGDILKIGSEIFNEKNEKISKYIDWDNEELIIEYNNDPVKKFYKGKVDKYGNLDGRGKLTYQNGAVYIGDFETGRPSGKGNLTYKDGKVYVGDFKYGRPHGIGTFTSKIGHMYKGNFMYGRKTGEGELTIVNENTKEPLYAQVYDKNGIMESVEYLFKDGDSSKIVIYYDKINKALNEGKVKEFKDLKMHIKVCDKYGKEIEDQDSFNFNLIIYQMLARLKNEYGELDDENRMRGGNPGLQNLIVLAELINNIKALNRARFGIERNGSSYLKYVYEDIESFLKSLCLTKDNPPKNKQLTSIDTLLSNGVNCICVNMTNTTGNHAVSGIIDLIKLKQFLLKKENGELKKLSKEELEELENLFMFKAPLS